MDEETQAAIQSLQNQWDTLYVRVDALESRVTALESPSEPPPEQPEE